MSDNQSHQGADLKPVKRSIEEIHARRQKWIGRAAVCQAKADCAEDEQDKAYFMGAKIVFLHKRREIDWVLGIDPDADDPELG